MGELTVTILGVACYLHKEETAFSAFQSSRILSLQRSPVARHASDCVCVDKRSVTEVETKLTFQSHLQEEYY